MNMGTGDDRVKLNTDIVSTVFGGDGNDLLIGGGAGVDHIDGGAGRDTFLRNLYLPGSGFSLSGDERGDEPAQVAGAFLSETAGPDGMFDIQQAGSPTCAFLATLSSVAGQTGTNDDLVNNIRYDAARDLYGVNFFVQGTKVVTVSNGIPGLSKPVTVTVPTIEQKTVWVNGDLTEGRDPGGKLWVTLYLKAYLQLVGAATRDANGACLESTQRKAATGKEWNNVSNMYFAITGRVAGFVKSANATAQSMFDQFNKSNNKGMVASSRDSGTSAGVIANHCYSVYKIFKDEKGNWLVRLRSPWGVDGRVGSMYDCNSEKQQFANDGLITLTWSQFTSNF
ncbi:MAG TPA: C2 family cysteine protease, partial [Planctomycetaceae bacterium]|nr:C2 family cysteine protease [Planctomycetaceae bacterium]